MTWWQVVLTVIGSLALAAFSVAVFAVLCIDALFGSINHKHITIKEWWLIRSEHRRRNKSGK